jgi:hypothetical protein
LESAVTPRKHSLLRSIWNFILFPIIGTNLFAHFWGATKGEQAIILILLCMVGRIDYQEWLNGR